MLKFLPYTLKTLWRHRSRTILTVSGSAVALFVFCFIGSVQEGMNDLQRRQESKLALISFQANKFCPATSHLPQDYDAKLEALDGVRDVMPVQVFTNNCRASLDVVVFYGVPPKKLRKARDFELESGSWDDFEHHQDAAVVGRAVASRRDVHVGDKFSIGDLSVNVAGIFSSSDPAEENYIYSHLEFLQRGKGMDLVGTVTQFEVLLDGGVDEQPHLDRALRHCLNDRPGLLGSHVSGAFWIEVQPQRIGPRPDGGQGVVDVRDAADFDLEHGRTASPGWSQAFVVTRFIGSEHGELCRNRMNAVTTNGSRDR